MTSSQEIALVASSQTPDQLAELEAILLGEIEPPTQETDSEAASLEIVRQILGAQTEAEVEAFGTAVGWRELATRYVAHDGLKKQDGLPVELIDFAWRASEYEQGAPVFFVVRATALGDHAEAGIVAGDQVILTTGSLNILAQLVAWDRLAREGKGRLRGRVVEAVETEKATKGGYWPMHLETPVSVKTALAAGDKEAKAGV